ncbi:GH-E family nuclease [Mycobacterium angelicum]|uniref:GH-E family nuclease n=1 Tax=Mycobacterium angelicum TaxID=470074 RepID=UPI001475D7BB|nr:GH-E family nuclease [Mycobacterium angelicum]MCV7198757.1 hypothetical protein [Mycobacterium angelicum]
MAKQYEDAILNLSKSADGKYYLGPDGVRYPVDPVYHLGHLPNEEWWRIRDTAIREHWTRQQLIEYCNSPSFISSKTRLETSATRLNYRERRDERK